MTQANAESIPAAIADYRILEAIGDGNNGRFYLAEAPARLGLSTDRVAIKVFSAPVDSDAYRRGVRELRAFASVQSPRLVQIYDVVLEGNFMYAMEYFPLGSLASPTRPLQRVEVLRALRDAARAVDELHEHGMVHGDVKPANVMVTPDGGRLSDLGLARVFEAQGMVTSFAPTTSVEFMDPDLLQGESPSRASDVYSLGATIHRALAGASLYGDLPMDQPMLAIRAVVSGKARVSTTLNRAEADLIARCIAPVDSRYATAAEVAEALDALN
jgi:eukaryotic-like serine/threonine-protein kinase